MTAGARRTPLVSVVIPTFNRAHVIAETLASVRAQTLDDLEIIVVDDGSTDATAERVIAIDDPRLVYVHQPNGGVSAARNHGIRLARGELIAFLDSDDLWQPDKLEQEIAFLDAHPEAGAVFSDLQKYDGQVYVPSFMRDSPAFAQLLRHHAGKDEILFDQREMYVCLLQEVPILPSAFTIRRSAIEAAGPFDESWSSWEDWEFFLRVARCTRLGYIDRGLAILRIGKDSLHRLDAKRGRSRMVKLLLSERVGLRGDPEALAAIDNGIARLRKHIAWQHIRSGQPGAAFATYLHAFRETGRALFLVRALAALLPLRAHLAMRRCLGNLVEAIDRPAPR